jgi:hypothetical protein
MDIVLMFMQWISVCHEPVENVLDFMFRYLVLPMFLDLTVLSTVNSGFGQVHELR